MTIKTVLASPLPARDKERSIGDSSSISTEASWLPAFVIGYDLGTVRFPFVSYSVAKGFSDLHLNTLRKFGKAIGQDEEPTVFLLWENYD